MPRNPAAHTLQGFLLAAENDIEDARKSFEQAMAIDGALGNAWLGRGLTRIRQGEDELGRQDLQTAAALEPNRSILHSYLGKAFSNVGTSDKAKLELDRAKQLDPNDPTPWLYSAIENRQNNRVNEAVRDLEKSQDLNDNRRIYRSRFLLEQDRAVRSANLAAIYQDAGMDDVAVREATRGVDYNYSNASSHLFLANAYNALRDPNRINLRFETPWFNELLLANLLSPVGGGPLSQFVSEQEYSKLFEADRFGISSTTEYLTDGKIREMASQFGIFGDFSYSIDANYYHDNGRRPNNEIELLEIYAQVKYQITPYDVIFLQTKYQDAEQGDLLQRYNQGTHARGVEFRGTAGARPAARRLSPSMGTRRPYACCSARGSPTRSIFSDINTPGRRAEFIDFSDGRPNVSRSLVFTRNADGDIIDVRSISRSTSLPQRVRHLHRRGEPHLGAGQQHAGRSARAFNRGEFETRDRFDNPPAFAVPFFDVPPAAHDFDTELEPSERFTSTTRSGLSARSRLPPA